MKYRLIFVGLILFFLSVCCSEKDLTDEYSEILSVSWDKVPDYHFYIFTPQQDGVFSSAGDYRIQGDTTELDYAWQGKNIGLYAVALPQGSIQLGMYPEVDEQGHLYVKRNGYVQPLAEHDLLIATPQQITLGKAKVPLHFNYGMSLGAVVLELLGGLDGYAFNIRAQNLIRDGYVDLSQGTVIPGKSVSELYFSPRASSSVYELAFVPQSVGKQMKISITGMRNIGVDKVLAYELYVDHQKFQAARQYIWTFSVTADGITYKGFQEKERNLSADL